MVFSKSESDKWPIMWTLILINAAAICGMLGIASYIPEFQMPGKGSLTLDGRPKSSVIQLAANTTEYDEASELQLQTKSMQLEHSWRKNIEHKRQLLEQAPVKNWEKIAREGAANIQQAWNQSTDHSWWKQPGYLFASGEPDPACPLYPFQRILTKDKKETGIMVLAAPFHQADYYRSEQSRALFWRLKAKGHIIVGLMSYQDYPDPIVNPYDDRYVMPEDKAVHDAMDAWLHCSRSPDQVLPIGVPRLALVESDFADPMMADAAGTSLIPDDTIEKEFDIVFSSQGGEWNDFCRNWTLAKASVKRLIDELDLKVLLLGRDLKDTADVDLQQYVEKGQLTQEPFMEWRQFLKAIQRGRVLFVPNIHDGSPRIVTEALCMNMPIVVNYHIVGGWKYVNEHTGEFFTNSEDVVDAFRRLQDPARALKLRPREWFKETWGVQWSSYLLQAFLEAVIGKSRLNALAKAVAQFDADTEAFYNSEKRRISMSQS